MPRTTSRRRATTLAAAMLLGVSLAGCSGGDEPSAKPSGKPTAAADFSVRATAGKVSGRVRSADRKRIVGQVGGLVESWMMAAYLDGADPDLDIAFADFTPDAAQRAQRQSTVTSNKGIDATVDPHRGTVKVDLLAPRGRVAGVTARIRLVLDAGEQSDRVTGSLLLTKTKGEWRVFGFDLTRGSKAGGKR